MPDSFPSLIAAIIEDDRAKVRSLLKSDGELAQHSAIKTSRFEPSLVHWFYAGDTPLHVAAAGYRVEIAKMLLQARRDGIGADNRRGSKPLHYAADGHPNSPSWNPKRQVETIELLLGAGAGLEAQDKNGATPLHRAVRTRCAAAVECLLAAGADPTKRNKAGSTPFHLAVQNTGRGGSGGEVAREVQRAIIEAFLKWRVSPKLKDARGKSVLEWARSEWVQRLLDEGA
jgi:hypothetical protein